MIINTNTSNTVTILCSHRQQLWLFICNHSHLSDVSVMIAFDQSVVCTNSSSSPLFRHGMLGSAVQQKLVDGVKSYLQGQLFTCRTAEKVDVV